MMRTFVAVEINDCGVMDEIKKIQEKFPINAKPVQPENIHFTLQFIGNIVDSQVEKIKNALASIVFAPFNVNFIGLGAFPKPKFPRVIWIGVDEDSKRNLNVLAKKVGDSLSPLGFASDKPFKPHLTIFRIKSKVDDVTEDLKKYENTGFGIQKINELKFKKSELTSFGPIYSDLQVVSASI